MKIVAVINKQAEPEQEEEPEQNYKQNFFEQEIPQKEFIMNLINPEEPNQVSNFNMREKDKHFLHLQELIDSKKNMLLKNQTKIKKITKQNDFLEHIKNDYLKYSHYITKQKKDQMKALEILNEYIKDLNSSGELSEQNVKDSKFEQKRILKEIKLIQNSLDELIDEDTHSNTNSNLVNHVNNLNHVNHVNHY